MAAEDLVAINREWTRRSGEPHGVLNEIMLDSAVGAPRNAYEYGAVTDLIELAVLLLEKVSRAHAFQQANKRTAFSAAAVFLERNGATLAAPDTEEVASWIEALVERRKTVQELGELLRPHIILP